MDDSCECFNGILDGRQSPAGSLQSWKPAKLEACKAGSLQSWKPAKLEACKGLHLQSSDGISGDRQGCIPAPQSPGIAYSCKATVLNLIVIRGSQGADLSAPYSEDDDGARRG
jgi:hypothetical protein